MLLMKLAFLREHGSQENRFVCSPQDESKTVTMVTGVKPREVEHLISTVGSQAASDTDDMLWEELLQDPDSASSGSSDSEEDSRHVHSHSLPPANGLSSDEETFPQVISTTFCLANVQPKRSERKEIML